MAAHLERVVRAAVLLLFECRDERGRHRLGVSRPIAQRVDLCKELIAALHLPHLTDIK